MCGIVGLYNLNGDLVTDRALLAQMADLMTHRGPDDAGVFCDGPVGLAMRRLSIIDVAGGHQPISTEAGRITIVCNGEVFNFQELRQRLEARHRFSSGSDTEVVAHLFEEEGQAALQRLNGMFGFALWDRKDRTLYVVRDRLGVKPVYYAIHNGTLLFASEIKAILAYPGFPREVDPEALDDYFSLRYVPAPRTMFRGVWKLLPGHLLRVQRDRIVQERYWQLAVHDRDGRPVGSYEEELAALLEDAVRRRLVSEVPLGVFLSGGLDSSVIAALMQRQSTRRVESFSIGFDGLADESPFAQAAAEAIGTAHHMRRVSALDADLMPRLLWHLDEPIADPAVLPTYLLAQFAKERVTVALTGEGADELFAGYTKYRDDAWIRLYRRLPAAARARLFDRVLPRLPWVSGHHENHRLFVMEEAQRRVAWDEVVLPRMKRELYGPALQSVVRDHRSSPMTSCANLDAVTAMLLGDVQTRLADDLLMKVDKMTMASALEARTPFLDYRLVEFAFRVPPHLKLSWGQNKVLLRRVASRWLPDAIVSRPKHGFSVPIAEWFRGSLSGILARLMDTASHDWLNPGGVHALVQEHARGQVNRSRELWALLCFELWHRIMIEQQPVPSQMVGGR